VVTNECGTTTFIDTINFLTDLFENPKRSFATITQIGSESIEVISKEPTENHVVMVHNTNGELLYKSNFVSHLKISTNHLKAGIYILTIKTNSAIVYTRKIRLL
jgi:hypothetical protein